MELQNPVRRGLSFSSRPRGPRHSDISGPQTAEKLAGLGEHALWPRQGGRPVGMRHSARKGTRVAQYAHTWSRLHARVQEGRRR